MLLAVILVWGCQEKLRVKEPPGAAGPGPILVLSTRRVTLCPVPLSPAEHPQAGQPHSLRL